MNQYNGEAACDNPKAPKRLNVAKKKKKKKKNNLTATVQYKTEKEKVMTMPRQCTAPSQSSTKPWKLIRC